jgi:hypothetical protein
MTEQGHNLNSLWFPYNEIAELLQGRGLLVLTISMHDLAPRQKGFKIGRILPLPLLEPGL